MKSLASARNCELCPIDEFVVTNENAAANRSASLIWNQVEDVRGCVVCRLWRMRDVCRTTAGVVRRRVGRATGLAIRPRKCDLTPECALTRCYVRCVAANCSTLACPPGGHPQTR